MIAAEALDRDGLSRALRIAALSGDADMAADATIIMRSLGMTPTLPRRRRRVTAQAKRPTPLALLEAIEASLRHGCAIDVERRQHALYVDGSLVAVADGASVKVIAVKDGLDPQREVMPALRYPPTGDSGQAADIAAEINGRMIMRDSEAARRSTGPFCDRCAFRVVPEGGDVCKVCRG